MDLNVQAARLVEGMDFKPTRKGLSGHRLLHVPYLFGLQAALQASRECGEGGGAETSTPPNVTAATGFAAASCCRRY